MPCKGAFIQYAADGDYFAIDPAVGHGTASILCNQRRNQYGQLGIQGISVSVPVLFIYIIAGIRHLMALQSLHGQVIAVVEHYLISRFQSLQGIACVAAVICAADGQQIPFDPIDGTLLSRCTAVQDTDTAVEQISIRIGQLCQPDDRRFIVSDQRIDPAVVNTGIGFP